jgi:signal transduction histidine kinase
MNFGMRREHRPPHSPAKPDSPASAAVRQAVSRRRERLVVAALVLLLTWLAFSIYYRFWVMPYLLLTVFLAALWRMKVGAVGLVLALVALLVSVLGESPHPWADGFEDMVRLTLVGLLGLGSRSILDGLEQQRVTERRLIAELSAAVEQLRESEQRQAEAVQDLAERNRELQDAQEQLLRSERLAALGQVSATMAHELRNPLNVVKLSVRYVTGHVSDPDEKLQRNLSHMNQYVDRACAIINDLLAFSRLPPPQLYPLALNELVREAVQALPVPPSVTIEWSLAADLPRVPVDARQFEQAVGNLGMNALQAMPGGGCLTVTTRRAGEAVEVCVADTGPGIPEELQDRIFEPFYSTKATGTGLGLPLVREIAAAHGGQSSFQSAPGDGTCFTLSLPLQPAAPRPDTAPPSMPGRPPSASGEPETAGPPTGSSSP